MVFRLQLLHAADQEAGIPAIEDAPRFSAVLNALRAEDYGQDGTLTLSSGDAIIPGPFFDASVSEFGAAGRADILIQNELGFEAIAFGNHEFDRGPGALADIIAPDAGDNYEGALFPYLSTNLNFDNDDDLSGFVVAGGAAPQDGTISSSVVIQKGTGQNIVDFGIIGATTPTLASISSPGDDIGINGTASIEALAASIQSEIDALTNAGIDHIILLAHMQQIAIEQQLAQLLDGVDIIIAGGSNTLLSDSDDILRAGDTSQGNYPIIVTTDENGAAKDPVAIVNTDGNYKYVGQLVVTFDDDGVILPGSIDSAESGAYATDEAGVTRLNAANLVDEDIEDIVDDLQAVITQIDGSIFGSTNVFLNGTRSDVRTQETNLGNLTADANLFIAQQAEPTVQVSLKNGGGIRDNIGVVTFPPGATSPEDVLRLPPAANPLASKEEGDISQLDVSNSLRFNNGLTTLTVTAEELKQLLEHGLADSGPGRTPGRFPQVGGMSFSFDLDRTAQVLELVQETDENGDPVFDDEGNPVLIPSGNIETPGERVRSLAIVNERDQIVDVIVRNGQVVGNPNREIRMVTLGFLAGGGDGYPFVPFAENVVSLEQEGVTTGAATDADDGSEQDALAEYLLAEFDNQPFNQPDRDARFDRRIQNLDERPDGVSRRRSFQTGGVGRDQLIGGALSDTLRGGAANDELIGRAGPDRLLSEEGQDLISGGTGNDFLFGGDGNDTIFGGRGFDRAFGGDGNDVISLARGGGFIDPGAGRDQITVLRRGGFYRVANFDGLDVFNLLGVRRQEVNLRQVGSNLVLQIGNRSLLRFEDTNLSDISLNRNFNFA